MKGALRCVERQPLGAITSRDIAAESGANLASIVYHFGSKDRLLTDAVVLGLDRWLQQLTEDLDLANVEPGHRIVGLVEEVLATMQAKERLASAFLASLGAALHDPLVRTALSRSYARARPAVARLLGLEDDQAGELAATIALAVFDGLLIQMLVDPDVRPSSDQVITAVQLLNRPVRGGEARGPRTQ